MSSRSWRQAVSINSWR